MSSSGNSNGAKPNEKPILWAEYFMGMAVLASKRSKDPEMKVGAVLVSPDKKIIGVGYNGHPKVKNNDKSLPWTKIYDDYEKNKHMYVVHAEQNAIAHSSGSLKGATMYVTLNPCNECAKLIVQHELKEVVYLSAKDFRDNALTAAMKIFHLSSVKVTKFSDYMGRGVGYKPIKIEVNLKDFDYSEKQK